MKRAATAGWVMGWALGAFGALGCEVDESTVSDAFSVGGLYAGCDAGCSSIDVPTYVPPEPNMMRSRPVDDPEYWLPPPGAQCAAPGGDGACCREGNSCDLVDQGTCTATGGTWLSGETCPTEKCSTKELGACCLPDCTCDRLSSTDFGFGNPFHECASIGGFYLGAGTSCDDSPCQALLIAQ